jgi:hypothetical protein
VITKASEVLRTAKEYMMEHGWTQGKRRLWTGEVCAHGAIGAVYGSTLAERQARHWLTFATPGHHVIQFNDSPIRKFDDIVDLFDRAEKLALIDEENNAS